MNDEPNTGAATTATTPEASGVFTAMLKRSNTKIRQDRADAISEDAEIQYRRVVEDLERKLKTITRDRNNLLDLSPTSADSLTLASNFDADKFVEEDLKLRIKEREVRIRLEAATDGYKELFGN